MCIARSFSSSLGDRDRRLRRSRSPSPSEPGASWVPSPAGAASRLLRSSFSLLRFHISFLQHLEQSTTLTRANLLSPCSVYENGSSRVVSAGRMSSSLPGNSLCSGQRVFPQVVSPAPERTSSSVRHRKANWNGFVGFPFNEQRMKHDSRFRICNASNRRQHTLYKARSSTSWRASRPKIAGAQALRHPLAGTCVVEPEVST